MGMLILKGGKVGRTNDFSRLTDPQTKMEEWEINLAFSEAPEGKLPQP